MGSQDLCQELPRYNQYVPMHRERERKTFPFSLSSSDPLLLPFWLAGHGPFHSSAWQRCDGCASPPSHGESAKSRLTFRLLTFFSPCASSVTVLRSETVLFLSYAAKCGQELPHSQDVARALFNNLLRPRGGLPPSS